MNEIFIGLVLLLSVSSFTWLLYWAMKPSFASLEYRRKHRQRTTTWRQSYTTREINGKKVLIEADSHAADVIAQTLRTGKPHLGTFDEKGNFKVVELSSKKDE